LIIFSHQVAPEALTMLSGAAMHDIAHLLRPGHLQQLANILKDPQATSNDQFVALELLKVNVYLFINRLSHFLILECQHRCWYDFTRLSRYRHCHCHGQEGAKCFH
jgi:hypothetical protein